MAHSLQLLLNLKEDWTLSRGGLSIHGLTPGTGSSGPASPPACLPQFPRGGRGRAPRAAAEVRNSSRQAGSPTAMALPSAASAPPPGAVRRCSPHREAPEPHTPHYFVQRHRVDGVADGVAARTQRVDRGLQFPRTPAGRVSRRAIPRAKTARADTSASAAAISTVLQTLSIKF